MVGYAGNQDEAEAAVKEAVNSGARAIAVRADVADEHAVAALFEAAEAEFGGIDVVVHAAGRAHMAPIAEMDWPFWTTSTAPTSAAPLSLSSRPPVGCAPAVRS